MKIKLLKKVRKRFQIIHMPKGFTSLGDRYEYNLFKLIDLKNEYSNRYTGIKDISNEKHIENFLYKHEIFQTENECVYYLKNKIIEILRSEGYRSKKDHIMENSQKKVWYK